MRVTQNVSITMPKSMLKEVSRMAKRENRSISEVVRNAVRDYTVARRLEPTPEEDMEMVMRIIEDAKKNPMTRKELLAEDRRLREYEIRQAKKLRLKESDIVDIIHASRSRARRRAS